MRNIDVVLRYVDGYGWLGLLIETRYGLEDVEAYRTGRFCDTIAECIEKIKEFVETHPEHTFCDPNRLKV